MFWIHNGRSSFFFPPSKKKKKNHCFLSLHDVSTKELCSDSLVDNVNNSAPLSLASEFLRAGPVRAQDTQPIWQWTGPPGSEFKEWMQLASSSRRLKIWCLYHLWWQERLKPFYYTSQITQDLALSAELQNTWCYMVPLKERSCNFCWNLRQAGLFSLFYEKCHAGFCVLKLL